MGELGNKVMESMFDAWCDDKCKDITPDHKEEYSIDESVEFICALTDTTKSQQHLIEYELEMLVNQAEHNSFADGFYIGMAVAHGKIF